MNSEKHKNFDTNNKLREDEIQKLRKILKYFISNFK